MRFCLCRRALDQVARRSGPPWSKLRATARDRRSVLTEPTPQRRALKLTGEKVEITHQLLQARLNRHAVPRIRPMPTPGNIGDQ